MKKGFTLIEVVAVIALLAILMVLALPNVIKFLNTGVSNTMEVQEREIEDAALLYLEDYCKSPISSTTRCPLTPKTTNDGMKLFDGTVELKTLVDNDYITAVTYRGNACEGTVKFSNNVPKVILVCKNSNDEEVYKTQE